MIIGVLNQKGGVGKTTLSLNLASAYADEGQKVLIVDADPQGSSLRWSSARAEGIAPLFPVVGMAKPSISRELPVMAKDYDVVVVDGAPRVSELGRAAIMASDVILMPVQPSPFDIWATEDTVQLIREAQQFKPSLIAAFAVNRKIANTAIGRDVLDAFAEADFPVLTAQVTQRVLYAESAMQGLSVVEVARYGDAAREIRKLAAEIRRFAGEERKAA